jgi:hypothetical protein
MASQMCVHLFRVNLHDPSRIRKGDITGKITAFWLAFSQLPYIQQMMEVPQKLNMNFIIAAIVVFSIAVALAWLIFANLKKVRNIIERILRFL